MTETTQAETDLIKRTIAAAYRQQAGWTSDSHAIQELLSLASQVEALDDDDICCPCCQEVTCDAGCPLEPARKKAPRCPLCCDHGKLLTNPCGYCENDYDEPVGPPIPNDEPMWLCSHGIGKAPEEP